MNDWFNLFDSSGFIPRRMYGQWTPGLIWLHNISDFLIWLSYLAIPIILVRLVLKRNHPLPFHRLYWLFSLFIIACGTTHLLEILMFYYPLYRLLGLAKLITAVASMGTVFALLHVMPQALAMRAPEELEQEIARRKQIEAELRVSKANLREINTQLQALAATDNLTGLHNQRALRERLEEELHRAKRFDCDFSLLILDLDHFKSYNDSFGHLAGDDALVLAGQVFRENVRAPDFPARSGGEEFVVLLPNTNATDAQLMAERLRHAMEHADWPHRPLTVSIGAATLTSMEIASATSKVDGAGEAVRLLAEADKAMYHSKANGRNRVTHFQDFQQGLRGVHNG